MKDKKNPDWWKEIDPQFEFENLPEFKETKQLLKTQDVIELPEDEEFFERMHAKIMANVETSSIQIDRGSIWTRKRSLIKRSASAFLAISLIALGRMTHVQKQQDSTLTILSDAVSRSSLEDSILVHQHKNEFFLDLANENLDHLTVSQMKELMQSQMQN